MKQEVTRIDEFRPDNETPCENCGQTPTVTMWKDGHRVGATNLCGPCTWGEAAMADPDKWNE